MKKMIKHDFQGLHTNLENLNFENCHFNFSRFSGRILSYNFLKIFINLYMVRVKPMQKHTKTTVLTNVCQSVLWSL